MKKLGAPYNNYAVDRHGNVWSHHVGKTWRKLKPSKQINGYWHVVFSLRGCRRSLSVHRLILEAFVGPCPIGMECRHLNGDSDDNRLLNLQWGSHRENEKDRMDQGRTPRGIKQHLAKLTEIQVLEIKSALRIGQTRSVELAHRFGVASCTIAHIKHGRSWGWLKDKDAQVSTMLEEEDPEEEEEL